MKYSHLPIVELAFFRKAKFRCFTSPDHVFMIEFGGDNGPPFLALFLNRSNALDRDDVVWHFYDEGKADGGSYYETGHLHEKLLSLCLLMLGLHVERDKDIIMVAEGFSKKCIDTKEYFDAYRELNGRQIDYLLGMAVEKLARKYFVLSYCRQGIDIIQDIQKETAGMHLFQYRYEDLEKVLNQQYNSGKISL